MEISKCRGDPHRLGFAYQLGFVRVFQRFPVQRPLESREELLSFVALRTGIDGGLLGDYASWQQTVSRHQIRIREYLGLRSFGPGQERGLEQFLYEESCRLEQTAALLARAREYLKQEKTVFPAESVLRRIIGEQRRKAREGCRRASTVAMRRLAERLALVEVEADDSTIPTGPSERHRTRATPRCRIDPGASGGGRRPCGAGSLGRRSTVGIEQELHRDPGAPSYPLREVGESIG